MCKNRFEKYIINKFNICNRIQTRQTGIKDVQ